MVHRRGFLLTAGASVGGVLFTPVAIPGLGHWAPPRLVRKTLRSSGRSFTIVPEGSERAGDFVLFSNKSFTKPACKVALFVIEEAPAGHEHETVLSPVSLDVIQSQ